MPSASQQEQSPGETWDAIVLRTLKTNSVKLVTYVPDRVLTPLIKGIHADSFFTCFPTSREEEAIGIVSGAWMGGMCGAVLMQTSGFATLRKCAGVTRGALSDPSHHVGVGARHVGRVQLRAGVGVPHDAASRSIH